MRLISHVVVVEPQQPAAGDRAAVLPQRHVGAGRGREVLGPAPATRAAVHRLDLGDHRADQLARDRVGPRADAHLAAHSGLASSIQVERAIARRSPPGVHSSTAGLVLAPVDPLEPALDHVRRADLDRPLDRDREAAEHDRRGDRRVHRRGARAVQRRPHEQRVDRRVAAPGRRRPRHREAPVADRPGVEAERVGRVAVRPAAEAGRERMVVLPLEARRRGGRGHPRVDRRRAGHAPARPGAPRRSARGRRRARRSRRRGRRRAGRRAAAACAA